MLKILLVLGNQKVPDRTQNDLPKDIDGKIDERNFINHKSIGINRHLFSVEKLENPTREEFLEAIEYNIFNVVIIVGHSVKNSNGIDGRIMINDSPDISDHYVTITQLREPFKISVSRKSKQRRLQLVILAGCSSSAAARALVSDNIGVPSVISFRLPVTPSVVRQFLSVLFRQWIVESKSLEIAVNAARDALGFDNGSCPGAVTMPMLSVANNQEINQSLMFSEFVNSSFQGRLLKGLISIPLVAPAYEKILIPLLSFYRRNINGLRGLIFALVIVLVSVLIIGKQDEFKKSLATNVCQSNQSFPSSLCQSRENKSSIPPALLPFIQSSIGDRVLFKNTSYFSNRELYLATKQKVADLYKRNLVNPKEHLKDLETLIPKVEEILKSDTSKREDDPELIWTINNAKAEISTQLNPDKLIDIPVVTSNDKGYSTAREVPRGAVIAQKEINDSGGTKNKHLKIRLNIIHDDNDKNENDKTLVESVANYIIEKKFVAVVGHFDSEASLKAAPIYNNKVVMVSAASTVTNLHDHNPFIFRTVPNSDSLAKVLADYIKKYEKNAVVSFCSDDESKAAQAFRRKLGDEIGEKNFYPPTACNVEAKKWKDQKVTAEDVIKDIQERKATILVLYFHLNESYQITELKELANAAHGKLKLYGSHSLDASNVREDKGDFENIVIVTPRLKNSSLAKNFTLAFKTMYGNEYEPTWRDMMAYDAVKAIAYGLDLTQDKNSSDQLQKQLHSDEFVISGSSGDIRFNKTNGDRCVTPSIAYLKCSGTSCKFELKEANQVITSPCK